MWFQLPPILLIPAVIFKVLGRWVDRSGIAGGESEASDHVVDAKIISNAHNTAPAKQECSCIYIPSPQPLQNVGIKQVSGDVCHSNSELCLLAMEGDPLVSLANVKSPAKAETSYHERSNQLTYMTQPVQVGLNQLRRPVCVHAVRACMLLHRQDYLLEMFGSRFVNV